jgi:hypothetical protein
MRQKLGLDPHKETKVLLSELRFDQEGGGAMIKGPMAGTKLTDYELKELTQKGGPQAYEKLFYLPDEKETADRVAGLGANENTKKTSLAS